MGLQKNLFLLGFFSFGFQSLNAMNLAEELKQVGYVEISNSEHEREAFDALYADFDALIDFLQTNRAWKDKLYNAKERFIRSNDRNYYSTDFFGFFDESKIEKRGQISFYYSSHFHEFIDSRYPEFKEAPEILRFFEACLKIQKPYHDLFDAAATELGIESIFASKYGHSPILLKVVKYLPSYTPITPHYDGSAFSLFLDSTDNQSLLFSRYKESYSMNDFSKAERKIPNSILLIPGTLLTQFSYYPTPHIVLQNGTTRYASIAFAMRPNYKVQKYNYSPLPNFIQDTPQK